MSVRPLCGDTARTNETFGVASSAEQRYGMALHNQFPARLGSVFRQYRKELYIEPQ